MKPWYIPGFCEAKTHILGVLCLDVISYSLFLRLVCVCRVKDAVLMIVSFVFCFYQFYRVRYFKYVLPFMFLESRMLFSWSSCSEWGIAWANVLRIVVKMLCLLAKMCVSACKNVSAKLRMHFLLSVFCPQEIPNSYGIAK